MSAHADRQLDIRGLLQAAQLLLARRGASRLEAELLLASLLECSREHLYANPEAAVEPGLGSDFQLLLQQRLRGVPVAYLTGEKEFWSLPFMVSGDTLVPRPETELLVSTALELLPVTGPAAVLDLGTGCGAIAIAIASERRETKVTAADVSGAALALAARNAARHGLQNVCFLRSDWFAALHGRRFHVIVGNPPYVDTADPSLATGDISFEPRLALDGGHGGLQCIRSIVAAAGRHLHGDGVLLLEHGCDQGLLVRELFRLAGFQCVRTLADLGGLERVTCGNWS